MAHSSSFKNHQLSDVIDVGQFPNYHNGLSGLANESH